MSETPDEGWERGANNAGVEDPRTTIVLPTELAERLAAEAEQRGLSVSDLLIEYADTGLQRASAEN